MRIRALTVTALSVIALAGCSGADEPTVAAEDCEEVPARVTDFISAGAEEGVGGVEITRASAYRSPNYEQVYFVAGEFQAGGEPTVGVWVTNSIDPDDSGLLMAADAFAQEFTVYPDAHTTSFEIPRAGDDIDNARACLDQTS